MEFTIFYSWQSDLPSKDNRSFIEKAIGASIKSLKADAELVLAPRLDESTSETPGTPSIDQTIFQKILACGILVADVSLISGRKEKRRCPNPNVLIELGFAAGCIGWSRIICVFNLDSGGLESLPFDLRSRRILTYRANTVLAANEHKTMALTKSLSHRIKEIVAKKTIEIDDEKRRLIKFCRDCWFFILPVWSRFDSIIALLGSTEQDQTLRYAMNNPWRMRAFHEDDLKALAARLATFCTQETLSKSLTPTRGVLSEEFQEAFSHAQEGLGKILDRFRGTVPFSYEDDVYLLNNSLGWLSADFKQLVEGKSVGLKLDDGLQYFLVRLFKLYPKLHEVILKDPDIPRAR